MVTEERCVGKAHESRPRTFANSTGREADCFQKWTGQEEPGLTAETTG